MIYLLFLLCHTDISFASNASGDWEIYLYDQNQNVINLTNTPGIDLFPAWSPDGSRIAFFSYRSGNADIYLMNPDGSDQVRLTTDEGDDKAPSWSPDGSRIAFSSDRGGNFDIYIMGRDGKSQRPIVSSDGEDELPAWSPDGNRIAFVSNMDGDWEIYTVQLATGVIIRMTHSDRMDSYPCWSPDGRWLAFTSMRDGDLDIYMMSNDGETVIKLTDNDGLDDAFPRFSPDGKKIAYQFEGDHGNWQIGVIDLETGEKTHLFAGSYWAAEPSWRPTGNSLAVLSQSLAITQWGIVKLKR